MKKLHLRIKLPRAKRLKINYKKAAIRLSVLAVILFAASGVLAYKKLYLTNEQRFWLAVENNLSTRSVVRQVTSGGTGNRTIEKTRLYFGTEATIDRVTSISTKTSTTGSNVTTRTITTPTTQFVSYLNIDTNETKADGSDYNFESLKDLWAKQPEASTPQEADQLRQSFIQSHITIVPFGNFSAATKGSILKDLKDNGVYKIDFKNATTQEVDGKKYIGLVAKVKLKEYVKVLQNNFVLMGYGEYPPLDPSQYSDTDLYEAKFLIDPNNNNMYGVELGNQTEIYTNFGVIKSAPIPSDAVSMDALQDMLQKLQ